MELTEILESLRSGKITPARAKKLLSLHSIEQIENFAKIDLGRKNRRGIPEVIFAQNKRLTEIKKIIKGTLAKSDSVLVSRIKEKDYGRIVSYSKGLGFKTKDGKNTTTLLVYKRLASKKIGRIGIMTAGTADIGVAEEARLMAESMNCECLCSYDVGIAGIHRLFTALKKMISKDIDAMIVVAGMEGALPTVVSSLVGIPVIGVPASVGYGHGKEGEAALAAMLQSCSLGLAVVNIDNGIGAGAVAAGISRKVRDT